MLKLFWKPANWVGVPADPKWDAMADVLAADSFGGVALQTLQRGEAAVQPVSVALAARLDAWLGQRSKTAPVTIVAHGFLYDPKPSAAGDGTDDPFNVIYAIPGEGRPAQLSLMPLVGECDELGGALQDVAIAFAWMSTGTLSDHARAHWDSSYKLACLDLAPLAARALALVVAHLAHRRVPVRVLAHSLGTRLFSQAIGLLKAAGVATSIERAVLLEGAEFCVDAAANFSGCTFDVISVASRTDKVLHWGGTQACHPVRENGSAAACVIGYDGLGGNTRWVDLQFDAPGLVQWFRSGAAPNGHVYRVDAVAEDDIHPDAGMGHWACYTNTTNRLLVRDLVLDPKLGVGGLVAVHVPQGVDSTMWGHFNGCAVPPTPTTVSGRQAGAGEFAGGGGGETG